LGVNASVQRRKLPESSDGHTHRTDNERVTIDPFDWAVVIHEASHCVIGNRLGLLVKRVEFVWENGALNGYSHIREGSKLTDWLVTLLAGETAETEIFGKQVLPRMHARSDREQLYLAVVRAGRMGDQALFVARQQAPRMVRVHRGAILQLSHDLLALVHHAQGQDVSVEGDELARLLGGPDVAILRLAANG
jgi:hypothetical protein